MLGTVLQRFLPTTFYAGGVDNIHITYVIGALLGLFGGGFLIINLITVAYREYAGRTQYHRSRKTAVQRILVSAAAVIVGVGLMVIPPNSQWVP